ncbi:MAG: sugar nucleotide-binding protein, partial [Burkholderiaceae bacterium]
MRILLTGASGQLGWEMRRELLMFGDVQCPGSTQLDLANPNKTREHVLDSGANLIVNCAAYTAVDQAESEPDIADAVNHRSAAALADACNQAGAALVHFSTDYVFGDMGSVAMSEDHTASPIGVYGKTKLNGERAIRESGCPHFIFRTSWVYASRGKNFLLTMLRLASQGKPLRIVSDQWGA